MGEISNPATNGSTKKIIIYIVAILGSCGIALTIALCYVIATPHISFDWISKTVISIMEASTLGALAASLVKFFDTRDASVKAADKLKKLQEKNRAKQDALQTKLEYKLKKKGKL